MNVFELMAKISLDPTEYKSGLKGASKDSKNYVQTISKNLSSAGSAVKRGLGVIAGAVTVVGGALLQVEGATEDYRVAQGKLNTAWEAAGYSGDAAKNTYTELYKILGDTDQATEAAQLMAKLVDNEQDIVPWTKVAAGVLGTFGDALPIEGLIESANETARVGQVTGALADALNWVSISEDEFNEKLEACTSTSERNQLIMDTLSQEYGNAADAFYKNNEALMAYRETQAGVTDAMARVGEAVSKVKTALITEFAPAIEAGAEKIAEFIGNLDAEKIADMAGKVAIATGAFGAFYGVAKTVSTVRSVITWFTETKDAVIGLSNASGLLSGGLNLLKTGASKLGGGLSALWGVLAANPVVLVIAAVAALVAGFVYLWNTSESFRGFWMGVWDGIKSVASSAVSAIVGFFNSLWGMLGGLVSLGSSIVQSIRSGIESAWSGLVSWFNGIWDSLFGSREANVNVNINQSTTGGVAVAGSHASGLYRVPYDGYIAELHQGERVLTKLEASQYNAAERSTGTQTIRHTFDDLTIRGVNNRDELTAVVNYSVEKIVTDLMRKGVRL